MKVQEAEPQVKVSLQIASSEPDTKPDVISFF